MNPQLHICEHALFRYAERSGLVDFKALESELRQRLTRAMAAAAPIGGRYSILLDGLEYVCFDNRVVTVVIRGPAP